MYRIINDCILKLFCFEKFRERKNWIVIFVLWFEEIKLLMEIFEFFFKILYFFMSYIMGLVMEL